MQKPDRSKSLIKSALSMVIFLLASGCAPTTLRGAEAEDFLHAEYRYGFGYDHEGAGADASDDWYYDYYTFEPSVSFDREDEEGDYRIYEYYDYDWRSDRFDWEEDDVF